ncbi:MAG: TolC family protein [Bryobacteraceae bacterium]
MRLLAILLPAALAAQGQPEPLTLEQAEQLALRSHPALTAARLSAAAAGTIPTQLGAARLPVLNGALSGSVADHGSRIGAGALNASSLFSRIGAGFNLSQLLYDFGRTRNLIDAARDRAAAEGENIRARRAEIILTVRQSYYSALLAAKTIEATRQALESRRILLRQVSAFAENNLKSTLDVSFAEVGVTEAELELDRASNASRTAQAELSAAMGLEPDREWLLADSTGRLPEGAPIDQLIAEARNARPELAVLRRQIDAARHFAEAEKRLVMPTLSLAGAGGFVPAGDPRLNTRYGGIGLTVSVPVFNGNLNAARRDEASLRAQLAEQTLRERELSIARGVKLAWIESDNALRRVAATARYRDQTAKALRLAQSRYDLGLSSIVELTQAQTARLSADVQNAAARYELQLRLSRLDYELGRL